MSNKSIIALLLFNAYNAPWPKDFNPAAFVMPTGDLTPIRDAHAIYNIGYNDQVSMAKALLQENEHIAHNPFHNQWLQPIELTLLNAKK